MRGKTGEEVAIPVSPTLQAALDSMPRARGAPPCWPARSGEPWTYNGFSTVWHRFKTGLEEEGLIAPGLTLKGLRHTVATTLREAGLDERRIADLLGQKTPSMARHYSRSANLADKNRETMATLEKENARRAQDCQTFRRKASNPIRKRPDMTTKPNDFSDVKWCPETELNQPTRGFSIRCSTN